MSDHIVWMGDFPFDIFLSFCIKMVDKIFFVNENTVEARLHIMFRLFDKIEQSLWVVPSVPIWIRFRSGFFLRLGRI